MNTYNESFDTHTAGGTLSAFVAGAAIGALAALILAPTSGRDARAYLKRRSGELGRDAMARGREAWESQAGRVSSAIEKGWERASDTLSHAREQGEEAYREAKRTTESGQPGTGPVRTGFQA